MLLVNRTYRTRNGKLATVVSTSNQTYHDGLPIIACVKGELPFTCDESGSLYPGYEHSHDLVGPDTGIGLLDDVTGVISSAATNIFKGDSNENHYR